jgi:hypothetical protein
MTSSLGEGPIPFNPSLVTVDVATLRNPTVWADIIQVRWQATDIDILSVMSSTQELASFSTSAPPSTGASSKLPENTGSSKPRKHSSSHSTGARAGIGLGVSFAIILLLIGACFLWRHSRRQKLPRAGGAIEDAPIGGRHEIDSRPIKYTTEAELDGNDSQIFELPVRDDH